CGETVEVRAFGDRTQKKFVLSATLRRRVRAFGNRDSCFWRPKFVLSITELSLSSDLARINRGSIRGK
ncbi:hypothetical protein, partial [Aestuariibaculum lutulentum]